jgi:hypothetical protein
MTPRLTYKNITYLGLIQVGVIVAGVLAAGVTFKYFDTFGIATPYWTRIGLGYGFFMLAVPVLWITVALIVQHRDQTGDAPEAVTYLSGVVVLLLLMVGAFQAAALPWVRLFSCSFSLSA